MINIILLPIIFDSFLFCKVRNAWGDLRMYVIKYAYKRIAPGTAGVYSYETGEEPVLYTVGDSPLHFASNVPGGNPRQEAFDCVLGG